MDNPTSDRGVVTPERAKHVWASTTQVEDIELTVGALLDEGTQDPPAFVEPALETIKADESSGKTLEELAVEDETFAEFLNWVIEDNNRVRLLMLPAPVSNESLRSDDWWTQLFIDLECKDGRSVVYEALATEPFDFFGRLVNSQFGLASANFAGYAAVAAAAANSGFDICTTRTYHLNAAQDGGHTRPHIVAQRSDFPLDIVDQAHVPEVVVDPGSLFDESDADRPWAVFHSIGAPTTPVEWIRKDLAGLAEKMRYRQHQAIIASIYDEQLEDWQTLAEVVATNGADAIELNLSLPTRPKGMICIGGEDLKDGPGKSFEVIAGVRGRLKEIGKPNFPLFAKLSYMNAADLAEWYETCQAELDGITAINARKVRAVRSDGSATFQSGPGEWDRTELVGCSDSATAEQARLMIRRLHELRCDIDRPAGKRPMMIIANGGVRGPNDVAEFRRLGADVVQSCSVGYRDRLLAGRVRGKAHLDLVVPGSSTSSVRSAGDSPESAPLNIRRGPEAKPQAGSALRRIVGDVLKALEGGGLDGFRPPRRSDS